MRHESSRSGVNDSANRGTSHVETPTSADHQQSEETQTRHQGHQGVGVEGGGEGRGAGSNSLTLTSSRHSPPPLPTSHPSQPPQSAQPQHSPHPPPHPRPSITLNGPSGIRHRRQSHDVPTALSPGSSSCPTSPVRASAVEERFSISTSSAERGSSWAEGSRGTVPPTSGTRTERQLSRGIGGDRASFEAYRSRKRPKTRSSPPPGLEGVGSLARHDHGHASFSAWEGPAEGRFLLDPTKEGGFLYEDPEPNGEEEVNDDQHEQEEEDCRGSTLIPPLNTTTTVNAVAHISSTHPIMSPPPLPRIPTDPHNLLPLSVPSTPHPSPPISRRASPFPSTSPHMTALSLSGHVSDTGSTAAAGQGGNANGSGNCFDASPRTSSGGDTTTTTTTSHGGRPRLMVLDMGRLGGRSTVVTSSGDSEESEVDEVALLTAIPGTSVGSDGKRRYVGGGTFWGWGRGGHCAGEGGAGGVGGSRTESFATAESSISAASSSSHSHHAATSAAWPQTDVAGIAQGASDVIALEFSRSRRKWRKLVGWARRKVGLGGYSLAAAVSPEDREGTDETGPGSNVRESPLRSGSIRLTRSDSGGSGGSGLRRKARRRTYDGGPGRVGLSRYRVHSGRRRRGFPASGFGLDLGVVGDAEWLNFVGGLIPVQPWSILLVLTIFAAVAVGLTLTLIHILNPDKAPLPWREYCQADYPRYFALQYPSRHLGTTTSVQEAQLADEEDPRYVTLPAVSPDYLAPINASSPQWPFHPHTSIPWSAEDESVDQLDPVGVFLGIFTTDAGMDRRNMIRRTYGSHWRSRVNGTQGVRMRFVMGQPRPKFQRLVKLEMEAFDDILLLDMPENMNSGKTHAFFSWAAENATVPDHKWVKNEATGSEPSSQSGIRGSVHSAKRSHASAGHGMHVIRQVDSLPLDENDGRWRAVDDEAPADSASAWKQDLFQPVYRGERRPDYVVKADEDSFIMIGELERRLRVLPRKLTYWGYLIRNVFMAGECYGLSMDLVDYVANSQTLRSYTRGKEDKLVARWMRMHPERENIIWASERCSIYDHPKAGTVYAHGFLFPSEVENVRKENITALPQSELALRGGPSQAAAYSSVSRFKTAYRPPHSSMSAGAEIEALVEGSELSQAARKLGMQPQDSKASKDRPQLSLKEIEDFYNKRPTRLQRFKGDIGERGGTAVVHFIKRHDWFLETALALLGSPADQHH